MTNFHCARLMLAAVAVLFGASAEAKAPGADVPPSPAVWRIADEDSEVFIFGAFDAAPADARWRSRELAAALDASEVFWFEAPVGDPDSIAAADRIFREQGMLSPGRSLEAVLPADAREALGAVAQSAGFSAEALAPLKPWAAFVLLSSRIYTGEAAHEPVSIDEAIRKEARGRGREIRYFGAVEDSLRILTEMPEAVQREMLTYLLNDFERQRAGAGAGFAAWRAGDEKATDAYLNAGMRAAAPETYHRLVARRADTLARAIAGLLNGKGAAFVSLSASYMVGEGSIPERLGGLGLEAERLGGE